MRIRDLACLCKLEAYTFVHLDFQFSNSLVDSFRKIYQLKGVLEDSYLNPSINKKFSEPQI